MQIINKTKFAPILITRRCFSQISLVWTLYSHSTKRDVVY